MRVHLRHLQNEFGFDHVPRLTLCACRAWQPLQSTNPTYVSIRIDRIALTERNKRNKLGCGSLFRRHLPHGNETFQRFWAQQAMRCIVEHLRHRQAQKPCGLVQRTDSRQAAALALRLVFPTRRSFVMFFSRSSQAIASFSPPKFSSSTSFSPRACRPVKTRPSLTVPSASPERLRRVPTRSRNQR